MTEIQRKSILLSNSLWMLRSSFMNLLAPWLPVWFVLGVVAAFGILVGLNEVLGAARRFIIGRSDRSGISLSEK